MTLRDHYLAVIAAAGTLLLVSSCGWTGASRLSPGVTQEAIRSVQLGMSQQEVVRRLGTPKRAYRPQWAAHDNVQTFEFSEPVDGARWYPMLWVHLQDNRVIQVYAKRYVLWGVDDEGVYGLSQSGRGETAAFMITFPESRRK
jgi:hypothetical protein